MKRRQTRETQKPDFAWKLMRLGDVFEQRTQRGSAGLPVLSVTMDRGLVARDSVEKKMKQSLPPEESLLVQPGDIVYNTMRMWQGAVAYSDREGVVSPAYVVCRPKADLIDGQFMHCLFKSREGQNKLQAFSHGLTEDRLRLYFDDFSEIPFRLPSLREQKEIAKVLGLWDTALETLDHLVAAKVRRHRGMMQRLFSGNHRRPDLHRKPWRKVSLGELLVEVDRYVDWNDSELYPLASVRRRSGGIFHRESLHGRNIKTQTLKRISPGDFLISKMQVVHGAMGVVTPECANLLVSDSYITLVPKDPIQIEPRFLDFLSRTPEFYRLVYISSYGVHIEKMTFSLEDFFHEKINLPSLEEQRYIANTLDAADVEIRLLRQKLTALSTQKRGMMKLLLTGEKRVRV